MSDERLADDVRELIARERAQPSLSSEAAARIAERLGATLAMPVAPPDPSGASWLPDAGSTASLASGAAPAATVATATWTAAKLAPIALAFALGGVTGSVITARVLERAEPSARPAVQAPLPAPSPAPPVPAAPGLEPPVPAAPSIEIEEPPPSVAPSRPAATLDRELRAERELLELARRALAQGHAADALTALEKHDRRFARGRLAEERDSLRVPALVMLGRDGDAAKHAEQFLERYPSSLFAPVVQGAVRKLEPRPNP